MVPVMFQINRQAFYNMSKRVGILNGRQFKTLSNGHSSFNPTFTINSRSHIQTVCKRPMFTKIVIGTVLTGSGGYAVASRESFGGLCCAVFGIGLVLYGFNELDENIKKMAENPKEKTE